MKIKDIKIQEPFKNLFRIYDDVYKEVLEDIKQNGFDENEPLLIWENGDVLIDGHTRLKAAIESGLKEISVNLLKFKNEDDALRYAVKRNSKRRYVTMGDKFRCFRLLDRIGEGGGDRKSDKFKKSSPKRLGLENIDDVPSAKRTAKLLNVSDVQVTKMRTIEGFCDEKEIKKVENDELTVEAAWKIAKELKDKIIKEIDAEKKNESQFNRTNDNVEWALWTWNPVTGCKHGCKYCYARDIANRFFKEKFEPTFKPGRLTAPQNTKVPEEDDAGEHNVFVCSMADLFGEWVSKDWINSVFKSIEEGPEWWNYILLTKNPERYLELKFPKRCWIGATGDIQKRVDIALDVFKQLKEKGIKNSLFLSCEPLEENVSIGKNPPLDWLIIGGRSRSSGMSAGQPDWLWVEDLMVEAREADLPYYWKPNLEIRPKEYPDTWQS